MKTKKMCAILGNVSTFEGLSPLTENRPLDTLPFDCKYRLIDFPLSSIANANINSIFMIFNEGETRSVFDHIGGGKEWNLDSLQNSYFVYFYQDLLKQKAQGLPYYASVIDYLAKSEAEYTVFMGSNMLSSIDLRAVLTYHRAHKNKMTVVYKKMDPTKLFAEDQILDVDSAGNVAQVKTFAQTFEKEERLNLSMNTYIVQTKWLMDQMRIEQKQDGTTTLHGLLAEKVVPIQASAYEYAGYLSNIQDVPSYYQANLDMLTEKKFNDLMYKGQKIYTKRKNEVPTYYSEASKVTNSQCATGCIIEGSLESSLISRRAIIKKGAKIKQAIIMSNAQIEEDAEISYAILDKYVTVKPGVRIIGSAQNPVVIPKNQVVENDVIGGLEL